MITKMPCVIVSEKWAFQAYVKFFTKINTSGIALGAFDLLVAVMYPKNSYQKSSKMLWSHSLVKVLDEDAKDIYYRPLPYSSLSPKTAGLPKFLSLNI